MKQEPRYRPHTNRSGRPKVPYTKEEAIATVARIVDSDDRNGRLRRSAPCAYPCSECDAWHIGNWSDHAYAAALRRGQSTSAGGSGREGAGAVDEGELAARRTTTALAVAVTAALLSVLFQVLHALSVPAPSLWMLLLAWAAFLATVGVVVWRRTGRRGQGAG